MDVHQSVDQIRRIFQSRLICPQKVVQLNVSLRHGCLPRRKRPAELGWVAQTGAGKDGFGDSAIGLITTCVKVALVAALKRERLVRDYWLSISKRR